MARGAWRLPGYRVEELLGAGSSGEVWRGRVNSTGSAVALKRIWLSDAAQRKAGLSEAAMLSSLDHPHLMKLHEIRHVDDDAIVLVLDLASAGSLATLLARRGRLTVGEVITAIAPIGAALAYAHHSGVVHGDVSAANILFTDIGLPLLADLGVARLLGDAAPVHTTPAYADPLVAAGALPGPASDVFMLGAVALHALTGAPAWPGTVPEEVLEAAMTGEQPDFAGRLAAAGVPVATAEVVARALTIDAAHRGTATEFALELRHSGEPVAVELSAGRSLASALAGHRVESWPLESVPAMAPATGDVPAAPEPVVPFAREQPLTYGVRAPSPYATPPAGRHLTPSHLRVAPGFAVCGALLAAVVASMIWWWPSGGGKDGHHRPTRVAAATSRPAAVERASPHPVGGPADLPAPSSPSTSTVRSAPLDSSGARAVLAGLDATRAAAFDTRDPGLLSSVYASPALLARDRALLTAIVPSGCGLRGVHTQFSRVVVTARTTDRVRVRVRAALPASTLMCAGTASGHAAGAAATSMQVELVRHAGGYRIAAQHRG